MAGQPSPDVFLCGSAALRWDRSRHSAAQYGNTGCTQQGRQQRACFPHVESTLPAGTEWGRLALLTRRLSATKNTANVINGRPFIGPTVFGSCKLSFHTDKTGVGQISKEPYRTSPPPRL